MKLVTKDFAKKQILRFSSLNRFPYEEGPLGDLIAALQTAESPQTAERWVSRIMEEATTETRCPMPGDIRGALRAIQDTRKHMIQCRTCDGAGWVTVFRLVTYRAGTYKVIRSEAIPMPPDDGTIDTVPGKVIEDFRAKLGSDQDILSAAKPCHCLSPQHKVYTGERE